MPPVANKNFIWLFATILIISWYIWRYKSHIRSYLINHGSHEFMFRVFDIATSSLILFCALPALLISMIALRLHFGRKKVFFRQLRIGKNQQPFTLLKFQTMTDSKDKDGCLLKDSERLTWLGHLLRSTYIDEIPGLFNVLKGDLSLIGPRPLVIEDLNKYASEEDLLRHKVKPGITGWAQVNGRNHISWKDKFSLDLWYVENRSLLLNILIVVLTAWKVIKREGIYKPGQKLKMPHPLPQKNDY